MAAQADGRSTPGQNRGATPVRRLLNFVAIGLLFAAFPAEISNQLLIHRSPRGFVITMLSYVWFLALGYWVGRLLDRKCRTLFASRLLYFVSYGCVGLLIEWFLLGVYPFAVSPVQLMMFSFWAGMMLTPRIFIDGPTTPELIVIRRGLLRYLVVWPAIALLPFCVAALFAPDHTEGPRNFSMLVFGVGALGLNYHFFRYFRLLRAEPCC